MPEPREKRPGETTFGFLMLLLAIVAVWQSYEISGLSALSSPGAFPVAASVIMLIAAVIVVIKNLRTAGKRLSDTARAFTADVTPAVVIVFTGFVVGYSALLDTLGFLPTSFVFLLVAIQFLHRRGLGFSAVVALASLITIYVVFRLLFTVVLPEGIVPEREILAWIERLFAAGGNGQ